MNAMREYKSGAPAFGGVKSSSSAKRKPKAAVKLPKQKPTAMSAQPALGQNLAAMLGGGQGQPPYA